jgi:hypothetical protein
LRFKDCLSIIFFYWRLVFKFKEFGAVSGYPLQSFYNPAGLQKGFSLLSGLGVCRAATVGFHFGCRQTCLFFFAAAGYAAAGFFYFACSQTEE